MQEAVLSMLKSSVQFLFSKAMEMFKTRSCLIFGYVIQVTIFNTNNLALKKKMEVDGLKMDNFMLYMS